MIDGAGAAMRWCASSASSLYMTLDSFFDARAALCPPRTASPCQVSSDMLRRRSCPSSPTATGRQGGTRAVRRGAGDSARAYAARRCSAPGSARCSGGILFSPGSQAGGRRPYQRCFYAALPAATWHPGSPLFIHPAQVRLTALSYPHVQGYNQP